MSTHRHIDRICAAAVVLTLLLTAAFINGEALGIQPASRAQGYESRLFDTGRVHTLDIVMDDWDAFIETCESEEYSACSVIIDNEAYRNVGLRAKGNTSLSTVSSLGSDRYSFKIEFDCYDSGKTYYGLDKLCLNNIIQDNTYMKDYLTYRMMGEFGVDAPLCSYVYITVNGEDWGLYLAVEGVEDGFLQRNYGSRHGALYKPDSTGLGGGRGNGRDFDMGDFMENGAEAAEAVPRFRSMEPPEAADGGSPPEFEKESLQDGGASPAVETGTEGASPAAGGGPGGFGGMGADDVKLQYIDDDPDSYSNIFSNAKTDVSEADRERLIQALKILGSGGDIEEAVDVDKVLRYFVVHNFVCNGDSYTGSIVHNYYLYEEDGRLSMIPWDYNLAFGTFRAGDASGAVNDPIDTPMSVTGGGDRPMIDWIFSSGEYTARYHRYFQAFLDAADPLALIEETCALIAPYVERDPTKFCTYGEFEAGAAALKTFCGLRIRSVSGQLSGTIPSTAEGQSAAGASLVEAGELTLSDMGTMDNGHGGGFGRPGIMPQEPDGEVPAFGGTRRFEGGGARPWTDGAERQEEALPGGPGGLPEAAGAAPAVQGGNAMLLLAVSVCCLLAGLLAAFRFKRRGR